MTTQLPIRARPVEPAPRWIAARLVPPGARGMSPWGRVPDLEGRSTRRGEVVGQRGQARAHGIVDPGLERCLPRFSGSAIAAALVLLALSGGALAAQVCKYDSIRATAPASRFTDNGDGTVTDSVTELQWARCSEGQTWSGGTCTGTAATYTWSQALQRADQSTLTGQGDWRLPNLKELSSIVERACVDPSVDLGVFPATPSNYFWSSSPHAHYPDYAWFVAFVDGYGSGWDKSSAEYVRLVRGGQ